MRQFYREYHSSPKLQPVVGEIEPDHPSTLQESAGAGVLSAHDPQVRLVEERARSPDRQPELRKIPVGPNQL